jgi:2,3-bisphosphoglycerate-dependent phosphoglycerate mutase
VEADLREIHLGEWEGGALRLRAAAGDPIFHRVLAEERWDVIPGAESTEAFGERLRAGIDRIVAAHPDELVVAVVHGGVIGQALAMASGSTGFAFSGSDNTGISELVVLPDGAWRVRRFNDTAHLDAPQVDEPD